MSKIAFLYPGQGAQVFGMGKDFYDQSEKSHRIFDKSAEILGEDICSICFEENDLLHRTDYTQAALVTTCLAMTEEIVSRGLTPDMTAGLSLGEYCAIAAAGGMSVEDAIRMVWIRGRLMHHAVPDGSGGMAAVLGMDGEKIQTVLADYNDVSVANYNCPGQIVITGKKTAIEEVTPALKEAGAKRVLPLNVSGPFHSPFLSEAGDKLFAELEQVEFSTLRVPYVTNVTGGIVNDTSETRDLLRRQVSSSVLWEQSIRTMLDAGIDTFIEIGPGKTLSGFMRKIDKSATMYRINTMADMETVLAQIENR